MIASPPSSFSRLSDAQRERVMAALKMYIDSEG